MTNKRKILLALFIMLWVETSLNTGIVKVDGSSMNNTLRNGEYYLYTNKDSSKIKRFDIVLINSKELEEKIIKRVIGLPGEEVAMIDGVLYVEDKEVKQNFDYIPTPDNFEIKLANDEYFVMGDNRPNSVDSRYIGPVNECEIEHVLLNKKYKWE